MRSSPASFNPAATRQQQTVRGHRDFLDAVEGLHWRISSRDAGGPSVRHQSAGVSRNPSARTSRPAGQLVVGQQLLTRLKEPSPEPACNDTAQIAAVGQRNAEIGHLPSEASNALPWMRWLHDDWLRFGLDKLHAIGLL